MRQSTLLLVLTGIVLTGCSQRSDAEADPTSDLSSELKHLAASYEDLQLMTPEPVDVNPELAMLCSGASLEMVEGARVNHGPHANCSIRVLMNEVAAAAFTRKETFPTGSIILKEKQRLGYRSDDGTEWQGGGNGVGGMIKREPGYDAKNGNWEYFYWEDPNNIEHGKMEGCIQCHEKARSSDFVFGSWSVTSVDDSLAY